MIPVGIQSQLQETSGLKSVYPQQQSCLFQNHTNVQLCKKLLEADCCRVSYNKTNQMHIFLIFVLGMKLHMFRTVPLSIIRSFSLYTQQ